MANAATPIIPKDGTLVIADGAALTLTIPYKGGDLKLTGLNASQKTKQMFKADGAVYSVRDVEDQEYGVEFTADAVHFKGDGTTATLFEALMKLGVWSGATSTLPTSAGDTYCLKLTFTAERTNFGAATNNVVVVKYVYFDVDFGMGVPSKFTVKGTAVPFSTDHLAWT